MENKEAAVFTEGKAEILVLEKNVFYNPVQEFNRDLSVTVLGEFAKNRREEESDESNSEDARTRRYEGITILEALSATGLRSVRYAKEVPHVKLVVANDISARAVESIKQNIFHNRVEDSVTASHEDATMLMYRRRKERFDAIDLDPYGCPSVFLDGAVQCIVNGGLLMVTATDMAVLAGNSPETCYVKYGAVSLKTKACHEFALRILLQHISAHAGRYGRYIVPLLSISVDFYIRVFVRVYGGQIKCKENTSLLGMVHQCNGCESMTVQRLGMKKPDGAYKLPNGPPVDRLCKFCRHAHHTGGPIWLGPLHDASFVSQLLNSPTTSELATAKRLRGVLSVVLEESDTPLYYTLDRLMSIVRCQTPPMVIFRSALLNAGYSVTYSHANKVSIKTDAPNQVVWDIVRAWEKIHPSRRDRMAKDSAALAILEAPSTIDVKFDLHPDANPRSRQTHLSRFQVNPTANWGPGARSITIVDPNERVSKREKNQNKNSKHRSKKNEASGAKDDRTNVEDSLEIDERSKDVSTRVENIEERQTVEGETTRVDPEESSTKRVNERTGDLENFDEKESFWKKAKIDP